MNDIVLVIGISFVVLLLLLAGIGFYQHYKFNNVINEIKKRNASKLSYGSAVDDDDFDVVDFEFLDELIPTNVESAVDDDDDDNTDDDEI